MKQDWWRKDAPGVDAVKRSWALRKGKPTEDDAPPLQPFAGSKAERLPGQLSLDDERHGEASGVDAATFLGDDPALALVTADMTVWRAAHPCDCDGPTCECECSPS